ncbi:MAG: enoyl-ACP reductase FabV [Akkermansiaceae bacterium]
MIVKPKIRGFICITSHPDGCAANVQEQIDYVKSKGPVADGPKNVLVIGSSTGYGLASRIVPAFSSGANTLGLFFEKPGSEKRTGTAGWYNTAAFEKAATAEGLFAKSLNGDAFSHDMKAKAIDLIKSEMGPIDLVVYSLASPRRINPDTGEDHRSVLKTTGGDYTNKNLNTDKGLIEEVTIGPATQDEIDNTIKVMGGEDWELWMTALDEAGVLADGVKTVSYSYIGPELTWPIYTDGTIGLAKKDLETTRERLHAKLGEKYNGSAYVSVNKALVTQASSAIPVVPLYISILYKEMKAKGLHEGCIEQIQRLFQDRLYGSDLQLDENDRIRIDDWEMREDIQAAVAKSWETITNENLADLADFDGYQQEFLKLFGFGIDGVNYDADTNPATAPASISE